MKLNQKVTKVLIIITTIIAMPVLAIAGIPKLLFSDIISGPNTGLTDDQVVNQGAIVTVWGNNLGDSEGNSKVYIDGKEAAHVYYWCKADGKSGGGPADMFTFHNMQEIAFAIPSSASSGLVKIKVNVGGVDSNTLDFTIRGGSIHFVSGDGNNSTGDGTWSNPWKTVSYHTSGAVAKASVTAGSIIYCKDTFEEFIQIKDKSGTAAKPISIIAYPGYQPKVHGNNGSIYVWNVDPWPSYWNIAKFDFQGNDTPIGTNKGMRAIGNAITDYPDGNGCATGQGGAISGNWKKTDGGLKIFGNYIHDFGCDTTSSLHHVFYITNRSGTPNEAYELGWNYLIDNKARFGLHIYDENVCGDWTGTMRVHDNVVKNQAAGGFHVSGCMSTPIEVTNNLFINCGLKPFPRAAIEVSSVIGNDLTSHIKFYNNTIYGYGEPDDSSAAALWIWDGTTNESWRFKGTWEWVNNIVVDTKNIRFADQYTTHPMVSKNNMWFSGGDGNPSTAPSWDTFWNSQMADPMFTNTALNDFTLKDVSPAKGAGFSEIGENIGAYGYSGNISTTIEPPKNLRKE